MSDVGSIVKIVLLMSWTHIFLSSFSSIIWMLYNSYTTSLHYLQMFLYSVLGAIVVAVLNVQEYGAITLNVVG